MTTKYNRDYFCPLCGKSDKDKQTIKTNGATIELNCGYCQTKISIIYDWWFEDKK